MKRQAPICALVAFPAAAADSASFYIRAIPPVGVREDSWGAIKKRFSP